MYLFTIEFFDTLWYKVSRGLENAQVAWFTLLYHQNFLRVYTRLFGSSDVFSVQGIFLWLDRMRLISIG